MQDAHDAPDFAFVFWGGKYTYKKSKVEADCMACLCRGGLPRRFVDLYQLGRMHSFSVKAHTELGAIFVALETCRRLHSYDPCTDSGEWNHIFTDGEIQHCGETVEFVDWALANFDKKATWSRAFEVRELAPTSWVA